MKRARKPLRAEVLSVLPLGPEAFFKKGAPVYGVLTHSSGSEGDRNCTGIAIHSSYDSHAWASQESTSHFYKWRNPGLERYRHASLWARTTSDQKAYEKACLTSSVMSNVFGCGKQRVSCTVGGGCESYNLHKKRSAIPTGNLNVHILHLAIICLGIYPTGVLKLNLKLNILRWGSVK